MILFSKGRAKRGRRGFTLIELLVVIAIIAVMAALITVASSSVLAAAKTAKCAGNLRAIGAAFQEYLGDNNNFLPQRAYHNGGTTVGYSNLLLPYLSNNGQIFVCPSAPDGWPSEPSYGMNWYYDNANISAIQGMNQTAGVAPTMQTLSDTILATDTAGSNGTGSNRADENSGDPGELAPTRHQGQANYLFFDDHVEKLPFSATQTPQNLWGTDQENHTQTMPGM